MDSRSDKQERPAVAFRRDSNYVRVHGAPTVSFGSVDQPNQTPRPRKRSPAQPDLYSGGKPQHLEVLITFGTAIVPEQLAVNAHKQPRHRVPHDVPVSSSTNLAPTMVTEKPNLDFPIAGMAGLPPSNATPRPPRANQDQYLRPHHSSYGPSLEACIPLPHALHPAPTSMPSGHQMSTQGVRLPSGPGVPFSTPMHQYGRPIRPSPGQPQGMMHTGYPYPFSHQHQPQYLNLPRNASRTPMAAQQPLPTSPGYSTSPGGTHYLPQGAMFGPGGVAYHHPPQPHFGQPPQYPSVSIPAPQPKSAEFVVPAKKSAIKISRPDTGETVDLRKVLAQQVFVEQQTPQPPATPTVVGRNGQRQSRALEIKRPPEKEASPALSKPAVEEMAKPVPALHIAPAPSATSTALAVLEEKTAIEKPLESLSIFTEGEPTSRREHSPFRRKLSPSRQEGSPSRRESLPSQLPILPVTSAARVKSPVRVVPGAGEPENVTDDKTPEFEAEFEAKRYAGEIALHANVEKDAPSPKPVEIGVEKPEHAPEVDTTSTSEAGHTEVTSVKHDNKATNAPNLQKAEKISDETAQIADAKHAELEEELEEGEIREETPETRPASPSKEERPNITKENLPGDSDSARTQVRRPKKLESFAGVPYPVTVKTPDMPSSGETRYKYDREFLLQFMNVCKERPEGLKTMDAIIGEESGPMRISLSVRNKPAAGIQRAASGSSRMSATFGTGQMGSFQAPTTKTSEQRFAESNRAFGSRGLPSASSSSNFLPPGPASGSAFGRADDRRRGGTSGWRDERRTLSAARIPQSPALAGLTIPHGQIAPLEKTENRWVPTFVDINPSEDTSLVTLERKVKGLLNKLTIEKFDRLAPQIMEYANRSENEKDGRSLRTVIRLIFEKATDEPAFSPMYARLCLTMQEKLSPNIIDLNVQKDNRPITGGNLFRKHLLNRCQEEFEKGWKVEGDGDEAKPKSEPSAPGTEILTEEYYAAQKKKRRGLGLIRFIGELFKLHMLTERIMHECVRRLLETPEEEETESLCKLLTTVGKQLDCEKARQYMDEYFRRLGGLTKLDELPSRIRYMVQDVIELRKNNWVPRIDASGPKTIAQIHKDAERQKQVQAAATAEALRKAQSSGGRGMPGIGKQIRRDNRDGWQLATKRVDTSNFGKFTQIGTRCLGPSGVFVASSKNWKADKKDESSPLSRTSSSNAFSILQADTDHVTGRRQSIDGQEPERPTVQVTVKGESAAEEGESAAEEGESAAEEGESAAEEGESAAKAPAAPTKKSPEEQREVVDAMMKEFWAVHDFKVVVEIMREDIDNPKAYSGIIRSFVEQVMEKKEPDVEAVASVFSSLVADGVVTHEQMRDAFVEAVPVLEDIVCDAPKAPMFFKRLMEAASLLADNADAVLAAFSNNVIKSSVA